MQPYDIFMLAVLIGAAVFGAWKGMAWQLASIASIALSGIVALRFSGTLAPALSSEEPWNMFLAMGILFAGTSLGVWIAFRFVAKAIDRVKLKEFDRQMGALFGVAKGVLYCLVLTFFAVTLNAGIRQRVLDSRSGYYAAVLVQKGTPMMPEKVRTALGKYIQRLDDGLNPDLPDLPPAIESEDAVEPTEVAQAVDPFAPLGQALPIGGQPAAWPPAGQYEPPAQLQQPAQYQPPGQYQPSALDPAAWRQQGEQYLNQQANQMGQQMGQALNQQVDQFGRQINQSVGQFRDSFNRSADQIQGEVNGRVDELGRRIQQAPMRPLQ